VTLKAWLYGTLFEPLLPPQWASLAWALVNVGLWIGIAIWMYRRRIFIKI
jgi:predicted acyltransferase